MPSFIPSQNKWLETSLFLKNVIFLVKAAVHGTWWGMSLPGGVGTNGGLSEPGENTLGIIVPPDWF